MPNPKTLGVLLIEGFADWEYPLLAASACEWFGIGVRFLTPGGSAVTSIAGLRFADGAAFEKADAGSLDALAVIGSEVWSSDAAPDIGNALHTHLAAGAIVGGICAGTVPLARAGLFEGRAHTSNGRDWLLKATGGYDGSGGYRDVPHAIADGPVVSAPGSAPGTFACAMLAAMMPEAGEQVAGMRAMFAREYEQGAG
jgi:putative intracellular protease/amidase